MAKQQFYTSLERAGAGYFDHYLLHSLMGFNLDNNPVKYNFAGLLLKMEILKI